MVEVGVRIIVTRLLVFGLPGSDNGVNINFCVNLKVKTFSSAQECNNNRSLHFNFQTTSHGVSGCWDDPIAECKLDFAQVGPAWEVDCRQLPKVLGNDRALCRRRICKFGTDQCRWR